MRLIQIGSRDSRICLVGEAPGATEDQTGKPFIGGSGQLLDQMLSRVGLDRIDCFITNVVHTRPPKNDFDWFRTQEGLPHYHAGLGRLWADVSEIRPNVVVALGGQALLALTGKAQITKWRGSILSSVLVPGVKVISTYHPASILRQYDQKAIAEADLARVREEAKSSEIILPFRSVYYPDGSYAERSPTGIWTKKEPPISIIQVLGEMLNAPWLAVDIETPRKRRNFDGTHPILCVGFADTSGRAIVLDTMSRQARETIRMLCASPVPKILQNGSFDAQVLGDNGYPLNAFAWETMFGHHALYPEAASGGDELRKRKAALSRGLAFQASIYTREPFYKDDGKVVDDDIRDLEAFYRYNALDCMVTREIRDVQEAELEAFGTRSVFDHERSLIPACLATSRRGFLVDKETRKALTIEAETKAAEAQAELDALAGRELNTNSPPQICDFLYRQLKLPVQTKKRASGETSETADEDAIVKLIGLYPEHRGIRAIIKSREQKKSLGILRAALDSRHRYTYTLDPAGTKTGRFASRETIYGTGGNVQNQSRKLRSMYIADPGKVLVQRDYKQAETWIVAYLARCGRMINLLNDPKRDIHRELAASTYNCPESQVTYAQRYNAKRGGHGSSYGMRALRMAQVVNQDAEESGIWVTTKDMQQVQDSYFLLYPEIKEHFWREIENELRASRTLNTPFGRKRTFFARWGDDLLRDAYSFVPQSTVGDLGTRAFQAIYRLELSRKDLGLELLANVHDSIVVQCQVEAAEEVAALMDDAMRIPISIHGEEFTIPSDCQVGFNWGERKEDKKTGIVTNPNGLRDLKEWKR